MHSHPLLFHHNLFVEETLLICPGESSSALSADLPSVPLWILSDQEADSDPIGLVGFPKAVSSRMHTVSDCLLFDEANSHWWPTSNSLEVANSGILIT